MERLQEFLQSTETITKINALQEQVAKTIFTWPALTGKEKLKRGIKKYILMRKLPPMDHYFWPNALLAGGLSEILNGAWDNRSAKTLEAYFDKWIKKGMPLYYVDNVANGMPLLDLYESSRKEKYLNAAERLAAWLEACPRDEQGNLPYRVRDISHIYADGIGMICPFLCRYGILKGEESLVKLGVVQIVHFLDHAMDEATGLPYHGYDSASGVKYGCVGWGRAVGWLMGGIAESLEQLPANTPQVPFMQDHFRALARAAIARQRQDGSFAWLLPAVDGPADSSATAMIACALLIGEQNGLFEGEEAERVTRSVLAAARFLLSCIQNGRVEHCSAECEGFAQYPQRYAAYPWSDGPTLKLFGRMEEV